MAGGGKAAMGHPSLSPTAAARAEFGRTVASAFEAPYLFLFKTNKSGVQRR
jgi:hypothetical protein